jgi:hypothetical protein
LRNRRSLPRCPCEHLHRFPRLPLEFRAGASARLLLCPYSKRPSSRHTTAQSDEIAPSFGTSRIVLFESYLALEPKARKFGLNNRVPDVRFGSKADKCSARGHVSFPPESRHLRCTSACLLWAKSVHRSIPMTDVHSTQEPTTSN